VNVTTEERLKAYGPVLDRAMADDLLNRADVASGGATQHRRRARQLISAMVAVALTGLVAIAVTQSRSLTSGTRPLRQSPTSSMQDTSTASPPTRARCDGVTFPIQTVTVPTCASFGRPVTLGWVRVTLGTLRSIVVGSPGQLGRNYFCAQLRFTNRSRRSQRYDDRHWSTVSVSSRGVRGIGNAAHPVSRDALRSGRLAPGGRASGSVCFAGTAKSLPGHLVITWMAPNTAPVRSAAWIGKAPS
jgi:hypothetical protein